MTELISVVIPCRNESRSIESTVRAILASDYANIEVIVVDGMSEDGTRDILKRSAQNDRRVRMIDNPQKLTPYAFNAGVRAAEGEYIQIVGSRNEMAPDYLRRLQTVLKTRPEVACVGGDFQHKYDSESGRLISLAMESKFGMGGGNYRTMTEDTFVDTVGVPMYRREIFAQVGYFDENLTRNQDDDFNFRLEQRGLKILYVHDAKVTYLVRGSLAKAFQQFRQYGYFKIFVNKKHRAITTWRQAVPAAFFGFYAVGVPFAIAYPVAWAVLAGVALLYLAAGVTLAGKRLNLLDRFRVVKTCFVLHAGYALGYWEGIWDFVLQNRPPRSTLQRQTT